MIKNYKGIWFFGLSGSGKTFLSEILFKKIKKSVIVDGDKVRKYISSDLKYSKKDREKQIDRLFGIGKIIIDSNKFPIISSVYFNNKLLNLCKKNDIYVLKIKRINSDLIKKNNPTYKNKKNVVGIDLQYEDMKIDIIVNDEKKTFWTDNKNIKNILSNQKNRY